MHYGFVLPGGPPGELIELACEAEAHGWEGIFLPDAISIETPEVPAHPMWDPWMLLAVIASRTQSIRLGPMVAALPRRRPWKVAREALTLDHLSNGRAILAVGLGAASDDGGFSRAGEPMDLHTRAALLDEGLAILEGLWSGLPFSWQGLHYQVQEMTMLPTPVQRPRIPVWVVSAWRRRLSVERALQWDGMIPQKQPLTPGDVADIALGVPRDRLFDIVVDGETTTSDCSRAEELQASGATWWLETRWTMTPARLFEDGGLDAVRRRIRQGPPDGGRVRSP